MKNLAEESCHTKKAREKLKKRIAIEDRKITKEALKKKSIEIHQWIARHAKHRIVLKNKTISLFDENQNTAKLSQKIDLLAKKLRKAHPLDSSAFLKTSSCRKT